MVPGFSDMTNNDSETGTLKFALNVRTSHLYSAMWKNLELTKTCLNSVFSTIELQMLFQGYNNPLLCLIAESVIRQ